MPKKVTKSTSKQLQFGFKVFLLPIALPKGQLTEDTISFRMFTIKVAGQTKKAEIRYSYPYDIVQPPGNEESPS